MPQRNWMQGIYPTVHKASGGDYARRLCASRSRCS